MNKSIYLYTNLIGDYFGTRQIIFDDNTNTIETHVIVEYYLSGSEIICNHILHTIKCTRTMVTKA